MTTASRRASGASNYRSPMPPRRVLTPRTGRSSPSSTDDPPKCRVPTALLRPWPKSPRKQRSARTLGYGPGESRVGSTETGVQKERHLPRYRGGLRRRQELTKRDEREARQVRERRDDLVGAALTTWLIRSSSSAGASCALELFAP